MYYRYHPRQRAVRLHAGLSSARHFSQSFVSLIASCNILQLQQRQQLCLALGRPWFPRVIDPSRTRPKTSLSSLLVSFLFIILLYLSLSLSFASTSSCSFLFRHSYSYYYHH